MIKDITLVKTIDNDTITYHLQGDKVLYETDGTYGIIYTYDFDGTLISFNYDSNVDVSPSGTEYYYLRNQQSDITKIIDNDGNIVVEYYYDAWGNIIKTVDTSGISLADINPYRYRGYRYDEETSLYYLNSRYYNPNIGRFINADGLLGAQGNILGHNMFAYTENNPVNNVDPTGYCSLADEFDPRTEGHDTSCGSIPASYGGIGNGSASDTMRKGTTHDISGSFWFLGGYLRGGLTLVINEEAGFAAVYAHGGNGLGYSSGFSYSLGALLNVDDPKDYTGWFEYSEVVAGIGGGIHLLPKTQTM